MHMSDSAVFSKVATKKVEFQLKIYLLVITL